VGEEKFLFTFLGALILLAALATPVTATLGSITMTLPLGAWVALAGIPLAIISLTS